MANSEALSEALERAKSISSDEVKSPTIPVGISLHEADNLHTRATIDLEKLIALGMPEGILEELKINIELLRTCETKWQQQTTGQETAEIIWKNEAPVMYDLREDIMDHLSFAYRDNEFLMDKLEVIREGDSHPDAIMDLANLAVLGKENPEPLSKINYDLSKLDEGDAMAKKMADVLASVNGQMYIDEENKVNRDKSYTLLKRTVDEIREYGKFAFRHDKDSVKGYASKYERDRSAAYRRNKKEMS